MVLRPSKHTNPTLSIINITGIIIEILGEYKLLNYDELLSAVTRRTSDNAKEIFLYSLSFLYLLGKVEYLAKMDAIQLTK